MISLKRNEIKNVEIGDLASPEFLFNMYAFYNIEYEFNDGKLSAINVPDNFNDIRD